MAAPLAHYKSLFSISLHTSFRQKAAAVKYEVLPEVLNERSGMIADSYFVGASGIQNAWG